MELTAEQIVALAADSGVAASGRKLASPRGWQGLGRDDSAIWGEFQGSARYQVRAALADLSVKCSCPSRKFPCKHGIGLLLMAVTTPGEIPQAVAPSWVTDWLGRRAATAEQREKKAEERTAATAQSKTAPRAGKTAERRQTRVLAGLDALDLWLEDLIRGGLAQAGTRPTSFWEHQAKRLTDAQAPGLATRLRRIATIPHASHDWPARLLTELGTVALLSQAFRHLDELPPLLQDTLRGAIGWTLTQEEVVARGQIVTDRWAVLSARIATEDRLRVQTVWLCGLTSDRFALILQFAHGGAQFETRFAPGTKLDAELAFWPGAYPQRALIHAQRGETTRLRERLTGDVSLNAFLSRVADANAQVPWLEQHPGVLRAMTLLATTDGPWLVRDPDGATLPLHGDEHWQALALTGGTPCDLVVVWDGEALELLALYHEGHFTPLGVQ